MRYTCGQGCGQPHGGTGLPSETESVTESPNPEVEVDLEYGDIFFSLDDKLCGRDS